MRNKALIPALLLAAFIPSVGYGNDVGAIKLTFKFCTQNLSPDQPFNPDLCTDVKPAIAARIVFRDQKIGRQPAITTDPNGQIEKHDVAVGIWGLGIATPPPSGAVPKLLSSHGQTRISVNIATTTEETFYLILPVRPNNVLPVRPNASTSSELTIGFSYFQKANYQSVSEFQPASSDQTTGGQQHRVSNDIEDGSRKIMGRVVDALKQPLANAQVECFVLIPRTFALLSFRMENLKEPSALAIKLRDHQDPISEYLWAKLSPQLQQQLKKYNGLAMPSSAVDQALFAEINRLLKDSGLFDERRFAQVVLTEGTRRLIRQQPKGADLIRLNRLLLEEAYPKELAMSDDSDEVLVLDKTKTDRKGDYTIKIPTDKRYESYILSITHDVFYPESVTILWDESPPALIPLQQESVASESQAASLSNFEMARRAVLKPQLMQALPIPGPRSFDYLAQLALGVFPPPETVGTSGPGLAPGVGTAGQFSVNGLRSRENNFTMDGSDNNDEDIGTRRQGFVLFTPQSVESLQEFQIITALSDARFGRNLGGQINALTQSGSHGVHGQAFGFFTSDRFNARNFFDQTTDGMPTTHTVRRAIDRVPVLLDGSPLVVPNLVGGKDKLARTQGGVVVGGRLKPINTFFFGSFDRLIVRATTESHFAVPTVGQRGIFGSGETGSFATFVNPFDIITIRYFPASMPGNGIFSLYPFANNPSGPYGGNTYSTVLPADADGTRFSGKLSKQFGAKRPDRKFSLRRFFWAARGDSLTGRYNFTQDKSILPVTGGALFSSMRPRVRTQNVAFYFNRTLATKVTDTIRFSVGRTGLSFDEVRDSRLLPSKFFPDASFLLNAPLLLNVTQPNLAGAPPNPTTYISAASPQGSAVLNSLGYSSVRTAEEIIGPLGQVIMPGFSSLGVDTNYFPQSRANTTLQVADTIVYLRKRDVFSMGFDIRKTLINSTQDRGFRPQASFNGLRASTAPYVPLSVTGSGPLPSQVFSASTMAAMGAPTGLFQTLAVVPDSSIGLRFTQADFFIQDEKRVRSNFSLTLGLRYELNTVPDTVGGRLEHAFDLQELKDRLNHALIACGSSSVCGDTANTILTAFPADFKLSFAADRNDFDVRVGFAWDPTKRGRSVVRGGFGIYSGQVNGIVLGQSRNVFPDFLPLNFAAFPVRFGNNNATFLFNPANPTIRPAITSNLIRSGTLNAIANGDPIDFLLRGFTVGGSLDLVLPQRALKGPYSLQYGVTMERVLRRDYLLTLAYVGTHGTKLLRMATPQEGLSLSEFEPGTRNIGFQNIAQVSFPAFFGPLLAPQVSPVKSYVHIVPTFFESSASSNYNSLQVEVRKRFSQRFQFGTALTYSHSTDDASDYLDTAGAFALPQNSLELSEKGSSSFDMRFRSVTNFVVDLPWKWQASGIILAQTGQPFTVNTIYDINRDGNLTDRLASTNGLVTNPVDGDRSIRLALAPGTDPMSLLAANGQDGAIGRNTFRAESTITFDVSLMRSITFGSERKFQFRTEIFNLFNRANFGIPDRILESPAFGKSVRTITPGRIVQFGFKVSF